MGEVVHVTSIDRFFTSRWIGMVMTVALALSGWSETADIIGKVKFLGLKRVRDHIVRVNVASRAGYAYDPLTVQQDVQALWSLELFSDISAISV